MFVGHYGVSFAAQRMNRHVPLWVLFIAVQLLDVLWAPFILVGLEKVRIVPGITASNPLDLYYMPYTHSLTAAVVWSTVGYVLYRLWRRPAGVGAATLVGHPCTTTRLKSDWACGTLRLSPSVSKLRFCLAACRCSGEAELRPKRE
jgi:hypothetical protein